MAERRMFAKTIINSAKFLRMPQTSRLLYYDLGMAADDDGVVEAFTVIRTTGAAEDDLRVLATKGFITVLNDDLVTFITDWNRNNLIKNDRYHPSIYKDLLVKLPDGTQVEPIWNPDGTQVEPEDRLGKDRLGKDRLGKDRSYLLADKPPKKARFVPPTVEEVAAYVAERGSRVDSQYFVDFYAARGWTAGKGGIMKDWKAACRNAERWSCWDKQPKRSDRVRTDAEYQKGVNFLDNF